VKLRNKGNRFEHGHSNNPTYRSWYHMKSTCYDKNEVGYDNYGGRGILVCKKWLKYLGFLEDMGIRPKGKSLDRVNNDGNYEAKNCRWATRKQQCSNRRPRRWNRKPKIEGELE
jgi:hypothetical protein